MKRIKRALVVMTIMVFPSLSFAYIGAGVGLVDEENFGYTLSFGSNFSSGLGLDISLIGFTDSVGTADAYWLQGNADLTYDFYRFLEGLVPVVELHPYVKGGFTYGATVFDAGANTEVSHGPGFNFGGGLDVKLNDLITVGVDLTENIIYFNGVTINGIPLSSDHTAKVFNFFGMIKFFAY